jgi:hypothetical protein
MTRPALAIVAILIAVPGLAAPKLKPEAKKVPDLLGTTWTGNSFEKQTMVLEFQADGVLVATYNGGAVANATWRQDGGKVYFSLNSKYCEFDGKFVGGKVEGQCYNVAGTRWDVTLTKVVRDR